MTLDPNLRARLKGQMSRGEVILFTGAGFSLGAVSTSGDSLPSSADLIALLWPIAFPGEDLDSETSLADVFEVAMRRSGNDVRDLLDRRLRVEPTKLPDRYQTWFGMPWHRIYTINIDDLEVAAGRRFPLRRAIRSVSALRDELPSNQAQLLAIHLNGRYEDYPDVTFSQRQYAQRAAMPDPWYRILVAELVGHPVVFVGTQLDEPSLWQQIELRRFRVQGGREYRPGSYLVTPRLSPARREILERYNIDWVQMTEAEFTEVLASLDEAREEGHRAIAAKAEQGAEVVLRSVGDLRVAPPAGDEPEFLRGRDPKWSDLTEGYAVERSFEEDLASRIENEKPQVVVLTGTAGIGKSTTLMRLALTDSVAGLKVGWLNANTSLPAWEVRGAVKEMKPDVLAVDDADSFGSGVGEFMKDVIVDNPSLQVMVAVRSTRLERLRLPEALSGIRVLQVSVPNLEDQDIELLLDALTRAKRLGELRDKTRAEQIAVFREHAGRQLLVAMIEATSGEKFEEKIDRECRELSAAHGVVYAMIAVATSFRDYLTRDEVLLAAGGNPAQALDSLQSLLNQRLVISTGPGFVLRHRVIADHAIDFYREQGQLVQPIQGVAFALATKANSSMPRSRRELRFLRRLINHDTLLRLLGYSRARSVYEEIEELLDWDYHYWLQRGSLEVEEGDLHLAQNFLGQAYAMADNDYRVQTEWAYLNLKRAAQSASDPQSVARADTAIAELEGAIVARGRKDSYPYHVLGSQGLSWVRRGPLTSEQRKQTLNRLRNVVQQGVEYHPFAGDLQQLLRDLTREYLLLSTKPDSQS